MKSLVLVFALIPLLPIMAAAFVLTLVGMAAYIGARAAVDLAGYLAK